MERQEDPLPPPIQFGESALGKPYDSDVDSFLELPSEDEEDVQSIPVCGVEEGGNPNLDERTKAIEGRTKEIVDWGLASAGPLFHISFVTLLAVSLGYQIMETSNYEHASHLIHTISLVQAVITAVQLVVSVASMAPLMSSTGSKYGASTSIRDTLYFTQLCVEHTFVGVAYAFVAGTFAWDTSRELMTVGNTAGILHVAFSSSNWESWKRLLHKINGNPSEGGSDRRLNPATREVARILRQVNRKYHLTQEDETSLKWIVSVLDSSGTLGRAKDSVVPRLPGVDKETRDWILGTYSKARAGSQESALTLPSVEDLEEGGAPPATAHHPNGDVVTVERDEEQLQHEKLVQREQLHRLSVESRRSPLPRSGARSASRRNSGAKQLVSTPREFGRHRAMDYLVEALEDAQVQSDPNMNGAGVGGGQVTLDFEQVQKNQHTPTMATSKPKFVVPGMPPLSLDGDATHRPRLDEHSWLSDPGRTVTGAYAGIDFTLLRKVLLASSKEDSSESSLEMPIEAQELVQMNKTLDTWEFDVFELSEVVPKHTLSFVLCSVFMKNDVFSLFGVSESVAAAFAAAIEDAYIRTNPYHNALHAADVLQTLHHLTTHNQLRRTITNLDLFGALIAATIHDVAHPGTNNNFLVQTGSDLAMRYNDQSVLENMHISLAFELMRQGGGKRDILASLAVTQRTQVRELIISMVLATDMSHHFDTLDEFCTKVLPALNSPDPVAVREVLHVHERRVSAGHTALGRVLGDGSVNKPKGESLHTKSKSMGEIGMRVQMEAAATASETASPSLTATQGFRSQSNSVTSSVPKFELRQSILKMALHCADVSNPVKPLNICTRWADRVLQEFYMQGDRERALGLPVSKFMDRTKPALPKMQLAFISVIVQPLFQSLVDFLPQLEHAVQSNITANVAHWKGLQDHEAKPADMVEDAVLPSPPVLKRGVSRNSTGSARRLSLNLGQKLFKHSPGKLGKYGS